jgi:uncharacterized protein YraI
MMRSSRLTSILCTALLVAFAAAAASQETEGVALEVRGGRGSDAAALDPGTATRTFAEANALYGDERYDEAAGLYEEILAAGFSHADVHYNLGNAYYRAGHTGRAVLAYERALRLEPGHEDATANLEFVRETLADRQSRVGDGALAGFAHRIYGRVGSGVLVMLASVSHALLAIVLIVAILRGGFAPWALRLAIVLAIVLVCAAGAAASKTYVARTIVEGVVLAPEVGVRTGPGDDFVLEFRLHEGTKVRLWEERAGWLRVSVSGTDLEGWLPDGSVEEI